jgi:hypothetical protein
MMRVTIKINAQQYHKLRTGIRWMDVNGGKYAFHRMASIGAFIQKSAKLRAPRFTGELASSIRATVDLANMRINVSAGQDPFVPYAGYQEYGYKGHYVDTQKDMFKGITHKSGKKGAWDRDIMQPMDLGLNGLGGREMLKLWFMEKYGMAWEDVPRYVYVSRYKPFMGPAVTAAIPLATKYFSKGMADAMKKSVAGLKDA